MDTLWTALLCGYTCLLVHSSRQSQRRSISLHVLVVWLFTALTCSLCSAQYMLEVLEKTYTGYHAVLRCDATGADFGMSISVFSYGFNSTGCVAFTEPEDACNFTASTRMNATICHGQFAMVPRGNCTFSEKAYYAQMAHPDPYKAVVIYNEPGEPPLPMQGTVHADDVDIPVAMVSYACMQTVMGRYPPENGYVVALRVLPGYYDFIKYLAPFVAVVGFCFIVLFVSLVVRVCRERRRVARKRLSRSNLKKLPIRKYKKGEEPDTCAICLDEFVEGEKLRVLPCKHTYHCKCIDPWLTKNRKVCPICKRKVCSSGDSDSSDSDVERRRTAPTSSATTRENAPLLVNEQPMASSSVNSLDNAGQELPSSSSNVETTAQVEVHSGEDTSQSDVYADTVRAEHEPVGGFSEAVRNRLKPFVHNLVNRAMQATNRTQSNNQNSSELNGTQRTFAAENDAFDGGDTPVLTDSTLTEEEDSGTARGPVGRRRRHPAAGGPMTDGQLDLDVELPSDDEQSTDDDQNSTSKFEAKTLGSPHRSTYIAKRPRKPSSRSMPGGLRKGALRMMDEPEAGDEEGDCAPASRQRSRDDAIFTASIEEEEEPTRDSLQQPQIDQHITEEGIPEQNE